MIYALQIQDGKFVKVGFAGDSVERRVASLQTGNPHSIEILFATEGTLRQEHSIHDALTRMMERLHLPAPINEWYPGRHPFMKSFLNELRNGPVNAIAFADNYILGSRRWMGGAQAREVA
jgi:hypothetical protein